MNKVRIQQDNRDPRYPERHERQLLAKMYEVQEMMLRLLDDNERDPDYQQMQRIIERLENYIQQRQPQF